MERNFVLTIVAAFSIFFFACEEDAVPIPLPPPPLPLGQAADDFASPAANNGTDSLAIPASEAVSSSSKSPARAAAKPTPAPAKPIFFAENTEDAEQSSSGRYTIQIAIFPSEASARALVKKMDGYGIKAYYARVNNPAKLLGSYYRVRVGFFGGKSAAGQFAKNRLSPLGYAWWVDERKNDKVGNAFEQEDAKSSSSVAAPTLPALKVPQTAVPKGVEMDNKGNIKMSDKK